MTHTHGHCGRCGACVGSSCLVRREAVTAATATGGGGGAVAAAATSVCPACAKNDPAARALAWLHRVGAIMHFAADARLAHYIALSPQFLIDAMRRLMGDRDLLAASAREVAAPEHSYLVDGVLSAPLLAAAWGPIVSGDARLTLVLYEMMRKLDLFLPLDVELESVEAPLREIPARTLVPSMLVAEEPPESRALWPAAAGTAAAPRAAPGEASFTRQYALSVDASLLTPFGLLHALMVRVGSSKLLVPRSSRFWSDGWSGVFVDSGVRARLALGRSTAGTCITLSVAGPVASLPSVGRVLLFVHKLVRELLQSYSAESATVRLKCPCADGCSCWLSAADVVDAAELKSRIPCDCGGAVDVWMVDPPADETNSCVRVVLCAV